MQQKKIDRRVYPAIFYRDGKYIGVRFPDLPGCLTFGNDAQDAMDMAREALGGYLLTQEDHSVPIPAPTPFEKIKAEAGEIVAWVEAYPSLLREEERNRVVKKTVTLPSWLNAKAQEASVNFSSVLQEALKQRLGLQ